MKEIKFSFDRDDDNDPKEAEVIDLAEYREYIKEFFHEIDDDDDYTEEGSDQKYPGDEDEYDNQDGSHWTGEEEYAGENIYDPDDEDKEDDAGDHDEKKAEKPAKKGKKPQTGETNKSHKPQRPKRKKNLLTKIFAGVALFAAIGAVFLASPVFAVKTIEMNELQYFTKEEICSRIGLYTGDNGVFFNKGRAEKILEGDKYISEAEISFRFPDTMVITIDENRIVGYINYLGNYLYIDREGRVIDVKSETEENLPIIEGLKFSSFTMGDVVQVKNEEAFEASLIVSKAMSKYEVEGKKVSINVSNTESIYAYIDNIKVLLGDTSRMEEKIKTMSEAVAEIPEGDMGTLDLQDLSKPIIFKYST